MFRDVIWLAQLPLSPLFVGLGGLAIKRRN